MTHTIHHQSSNMLSANDCCCCFCTILAVCLVCFVRMFSYTVSSLNSSNSISVKTQTKPFECNQKACEMYIVSSTVHAAVALLVAVP
eukprot:13526-Heterococcus_DN1.PRE.2